MTAVTSPLRIGDVRQDNFILGTQVGAQSGLLTASRLPQISVKLMRNSTTEEGERFQVVTYNETKLNQISRRCAT